MPTTRSLTARLIATAVTAGVVAVVLPATPAHAVAWRTEYRVHGARLQTCGEPVAGDRMRVRVRLDNRDASHAHLGGVSAQGRERNLRARPGQLTAGSSLVVGRYVQVSIGLGELDGRGLGEVRSASSLSRC